MGRKIRTIGTLLRRDRESYKECSVMKGRRVQMALTNLVRATLVSRSEAVSTTALTVRTVYACLLRVRL